MWHTARGCGVWPAGQAAMHRYPMPHGWYVLFTSVAWQYRAGRFACRYVPFRLAKRHVSAYSRGRFAGLFLQQCKWLAARMLACRILGAKHVYTFCTAVALPWGVLPDCGHSHQAFGGGAARPGHKAMYMAAAAPGVLHNASMTRQRPRSQRQSMCMEAGCQSFGITMAISKQTLLDIVAGW